jgi:hypothetical protein
VTASPPNEYARRQRAREAEAEARERVHIRLGNAKVAIFIGIFAYWIVTLARNPQAWVYGVAVAAFIALSVWHERVIRALAKANAAVAFYRDGIARIEDRWMRAEPSGERFRDANHPYADDLDIFGPRSLFQLLSGCRTPMGESRLAAWLLNAAPPTEIRARQSRVDALRSRIDLRERVAVVDAGRRKLLLPDHLIAWAEQPRTLPPLGPLVILLALLFVATFGNYFSGGSGWPVVAALAINGAVFSALVKRANAIAEGLSSSTAATELDLLAAVVAEIEREQFDAPEISALAARLVGGDDQPSASRGIARLARVADWADSRHNVFLRIADVPFLVTLQIAYAADRWRAGFGARLRDWVDAVGEMEALLSIAGYAYEHPADPFPDVIAAHEPCFDAADMTHPLIAAAEAVRNALRICHGAGPQILVVSGSNMSGKSTLMRTVGVNAVLALAGAPVRASRMRLTHLAVGTCLRHTDSLQEHRSGFYTEALRIRRLFDMLDGPLPAMFLFDELLSGTNSKDRRIAAEGVLSTMLERRAIGLVTTHDLSLTEIAAMFPDRVKNVHLQDHVENGRMVFDYRLRDGVITHSNALELMRMIGLDV